MEEGKKIEGEEGQAPSSEEAKTTFTLEEVEAMKRKMQSDSERGVQKILNEKKALEQSLVEIGKVADDNSYLIDLFERKPDVAKIILDQYYDGKTIDQYKKSIGYEEDYSDPKVVEKLVSQQAKALEEKRTIEKSKQEFISKLKMTPEETEKFEEAFEERKQLKSFSLDNLEKNLEKAFREISDNTDQLKAIKNQETIANVMATGEGKGGNSGDGKESKFDLARKEADDFLKTFNI